MKTFLTAAVALSLLAGTAATAQPYGREHRDDRDNNRYEQRYDRHDDRNDRRDYRDGRWDNRNDRWDDRRGYRDNRQHWRQGQRLPAAYYGRSHYVDHRRHHLRQPPRGYQWVRIDNDYVMVALATGLIASIIASN